MLFSNIPSEPLSRREKAEQVEQFFREVEFGDVVLWVAGHPQKSRAHVTERLEVPTSEQVTGAVVQEAVYAAQLAGELPPHTRVRNQQVYEPAEFVGGGLAQSLAEDGEPVALAYLVPEEPDEFGEQEPFGWVILTLKR